MDTTKEKTLAEKQVIWTAVYGGNNTNPIPFEPLTMLRHKWRVGSDGELEQGTEELLFIGMSERGDGMMRLKPANAAAYYGEDTLSDDSVRWKKKTWVAFDFENVAELVLHYKYADQFVVIQ